MAQAKLAHQLFRHRFAGSRWDSLAARGARYQRPLWASPSTKNPQYPDTLYVDNLIGPDTVNTMVEVNAKKGNLMAAPSSPSWLSLQAQTVFSWSVAQHKLAVATGPAGGKANPGAGLGGGASGLPEDALASALDAGKHELGATLPSPVQHEVDGDAPAHTGADRDFLDDLGVLRPTVSAMAVRPPPSSAMSPALSRRVALRRGEAG